jgi:hypothetical protein
MTNLTKHGEKMSGALSKQWEARAVKGFAERSGILRRSMLPPESIMK